MIEKGTTWVKHVGRFALDGCFRLTEQGTAVTGLTPITDNLHLYAKDKSGVTELFYKNSSGTERDLSTPIAHTILSTSHSDTLAGTVVRGDVIVGNSTPAWKRLPRGTASQLLQIDSSGDAVWAGVTVGTAGTAFTGGTAGSVLFVASGPVAQQDNANLFWDDSNNRLGIRVATPSHELQVHSTSGVGVNRGIMQSCYTADGAGPVLRLHKGRGTLASQTAVQSADGIGVILFGGAVDTVVTSLGVGARIDGTAAALWTATSAPGFITMSTCPSLSLTTVERLRILSDGPICIGTTAQISAGLVAIQQSATQVVGFTTSAFADSPRCRFTRAAGTSSVPTAILSTEELSNFNFAGYTGAAYVVSARLQVLAAENWSTSATGTTMFFTTTPNTTIVPGRTLVFTHAGNLRISPSGLAAGSSNGTGVLELEDGTAPAAMGTNTCGLYGNDVAGTVEVFAIDEGGAATQISPHNFTMFTPDPSYEYPWSYYSKHHYLGKEIGVDMWRLVKAVELLSGEKILHIRDLPPSEVRNWNDDQALNVINSQREIAAYARLSEREKEERRAPVLAVAKQPPKWIKDRLKP